MLITPVPQMSDSCPRSDGMRHGQHYIGAASTPWLARQIDSLSLERAMRRAGCCQHHMHACRRIWAPRGDQNGKTLSGSPSCEPPALARCTPQATVSSDCYTPAAHARISKQPRLMAPHPRFPSLPPAGFHGIHVPTTSVLQQPRHKSSSDRPIDPRQRNRRSPRPRSRVRQRSSQSGFAL